MRTVRSRIAVVDSLLGDAPPESLVQPQIESIYLQYRKILEGIAFSSLASNLVQFEKSYRSFAKYWNAATLFRDLERINPQFYPIPRIEVPSPDPAISNQLVERASDYLIKGEFLELYGRTGDILHERNPYSPGQDLDWFARRAAEWRRKIVHLLEIHSIHLHGSTTVYLVHLQEQDGQVKMYTLEKVARP